MATTVCFRVTDKEKEYLEKIVKKKNVSLSVYLRGIIINEIIKELAEEGELPDELKRVIVNRMIE